MAAKKPTERRDFRQVVLIIYVTIAVILVGLTVYLALADQFEALAQPDAQATSITPTVSTIILTLEAEEYVTQIPPTPRPAS